MKNENVTADDVKQILENEDNEISEKILPLVLESEKDGNFEFSEKTRFFIPSEFTEYLRFFELPVENNAEMRYTIYNGFQEWGIPDGKTYFDLYPAGHCGGRRRGGGCHHAV